MEDMYDTVRSAARKTVYGAVAGLMLFVGGEEVYAQDSTNCGGSFLLDGKHVEYNLRDDAETEDYGTADVLEVRFGERPGLQFDIDVFYQAEDEELAYPQFFEVQQRISDKESPVEIKMPLAFKQELQALHDGIYKPAERHAKKECRGVESKDF